MKIFRSRIPLNFAQKRLLTVHPTPRLLALILNRIKKKKMEAKKKEGIEEENNPRTTVLY